MPISARRLHRAIDQLSYWSGKAFAWLIVALTFVVSLEVFKRYILNAPTAWIFDFNNMLYGTLFMMCGAYTLALGPRGSRTSRRSTWSRRSSEAASTWTKSRAGPHRRGRTRSTRPPATAPWWSTRTRERSVTRPDDAGAHRGRHHDGLPHRVHADGPGDDLRLHRLLAPGRTLVRQPDLRPDRAADVPG